MQWITQTISTLDLAPLLQRSGLCPRASALCARSLMCLIRPCSSLFTVTSSPPSNRATTIAPCRPATGPRSQLDQQRVPVMDTWRPVMRVSYAPVSSISPTCPSMSDPSKSAAKLEVESAKLPIGTSASMPTTGRRSCRAKVSSLPAASHPCLVSLIGRRLRVRFGARCKEALSI